MGTFHPAFYGLSAEFRKKELIYISVSPRGARFGGSKPTEVRVLNPSFCKKA
jgi:hypothetical protein